MQGIQRRHNETVEPQPPTTKGTDDDDESKTAHKDKHLNLVAGAVTNTGDFELAFLLGEMRYHLDSLYPKVGDGGEVWISGKFDKDTGNLLSIKFGRIADYSDV
jgi:hypothetical protein